jgi:hypothetical protein
MSKNLTYTFETRNYDALIIKEGIRTWFQVSHPEYLATELNKFKVGDKVSVSLTNKKPKRTEQQNRYYWGAYLPMIANETGNDIDDLHNLFKGLFLSKAIIQVLGHNVRKLKSTTSLTTGQFKDYIMRIEEKTGILAPPIEEEKTEAKIDYPQSKGEPLL